MPLALAAILGLALLLRLALAPSPGFVPDVTINKGWAQSGAELGLARSYGEQLGGNMLPNYPPLGLTVFVAVGELWQRLGPPGERAGPPGTAAIKLPAIAFDLATTLLLFAFLRRVLGPRTALLGALLHAVHPAVLYDSAVWGQVDSIFTFFVLASLSAHASGRPAWAPPLFALGLLCKLQAVVFAPLLGLCWLRRPRALGLGTLAAVLVAAVVLVPFADPVAREAVLRVYTDSVGFYPALSCSSYNLWRLLFGDAAGQRSDHELLFGLVQYRTVGLALFGLAYAAILVALRESLWAREPKSAFAKLSPFLAAALVVTAFDLFCTEMHERYAFPSIVLGLPLIAFGARGAMLYGLHSLGFLLNLLGSLSWTSFDRALYAEFPSFESVVAGGRILVFFAMLGYVVRLQRGAGGRADRSEARGPALEDTPRPEPVGAGSDAGTASRATPSPG